MTSLRTALRGYEEFLWVPIHIELSGETWDALMFDPSQLQQDAFEEFIGNTFGDGMPEELDLEQKIPFLVVGFFEGTFCKGTLQGLAQPDRLLFADVTNMKDGRTPIYSIDIDGTAVESTFGKIAESVDDLRLGLGRAGDSSDS